MRFEKPYHECCGGGGLWKQEWLVIRWDRISALAKVISDWRRITALLLVCCFGMDQKGTNLLSMVLPLVAEGGPLHNADEEALCCMITMGCHLLRSSQCMAWGASLHWSPCQSTPIYRMRLHLTTPVALCSSNS